MKNTAFIYCEVSRGAIGMLHVPHDKVQSSVKKIRRNFKRIMNGDENWPYAFSCGLAESQKRLSKGDYAGLLDEVLLSLFAVCPSVTASDFKTKNLFIAMFFPNGELVINSTTIDDPENEQQITDHTRQLLDEAIQKMAA